MLSQLLSTLGFDPQPHGSPSGFFAGSTNVDARYGVFTDASVSVGRDLNIRVEMQQDNERDRSVLNRLPRVNGAGYRSGNHETCLQGTRKVELQRIEEWEADDTTRVICWLSGITGSGKSTIAQTFAERCSAQGRLGASFFCSRDFPGRRNIHLIFPTLAYYLALHSPEFRAALIPIVSNSPDIGSDSLAVQFEELLIRPLQSTQTPTTIIIDALDECEDKESTSAILSVIARRIHEIPFVKFFITGRPEPRIQSGFRLPLLHQHTEVFLLHEVDRVSVDQDIELYLRTYLSRIQVERVYWNSTVPWPSNEEISAATKKCGGLFIVAYIIVKFVASQRHKPRERLRIISNPDSTVHEGKSRLDATYGQIFCHSFDDIDSDDADFFELLQIVVSIIVLAFNPLSCMSLATILGITPEDVWIALDSLRSVFIVPDSESETIRICHKSLADYLTDATRCTDSRFYISPPVFHLEIGIRCLRLMKTSLRKNICALPRYAMNADVEDLATRRDKYIGNGLEYACKSWAKHLQLGSRDGDSVGDVVHLLQDFFRHHMLQWLEVLSIVSDLRSAIYSFHDVTRWIADALSSDVDLLTIINDSEKFVLRFFDVIESSATHIYESAIPLSPFSSVVRDLYEDQMWPDVKIRGVDNSWDACFRAIQLQGFARSIAFSYKEDLIAVGEYKIVEIFQASTGQRRATLPTNVTVLSLAFSPGNAILVTGGDDGSVGVWDSQTGGLVDTLQGHTDEINSVAFSPSGAMIATSSKDGSIRLWNASSRDCRSVLQGHSHSVNAVCWSATGSKVISGSSDATVKVWSVSGETPPKTFTVRNGSVFSVASSPDSSLIAAGSEDGTVNVFDVETGDILHAISTNKRNKRLLVRFLDQHQIVYTNFGTFVIRNLTKSADVLTFKYEGWNGIISSDGTRLLSDIGEIVKIWQTDMLDQNQNATGHHTVRAYCVSFLKDGQLVASGSGDRTVKIWDTSTGQCLTTFCGHSNMVDQVLFSPDSTICASRGLNDVIQIWGVYTGNQVSTLRENQAFNMCFSPDGGLLASLKWMGSRLKQVKLWEVATANCLASIEVDLVFRTISFDADGASVVLTGDEETQRCRLSFAPTPLHESDRSNPSSLPMVLFPVLDTAPISSDFEPPEYRYHYDEKNSWILDKQERRMFWVPPDLKWVKDNYGKMFVFGSTGGIVTIVDFSGIE